MKSIVTPRETQVIELLSFGLSQKEIAEALGCSVNTIDTHVKHIKEKSGLQKTTEIVAAFYYKKYRLPLTDLPQKIRKIIAAAMLAICFLGVALLFPVFFSELTFLDTLNLLNTQVVIFQMYDMEALKLGIALCIGLFLINHEYFPWAVKTVDWIEKQFRKITKPLKRW